MEHYCPLCEHEWYHVLDINGVCFGEYNEACSECSKVLASLILDK